MKILIAVLSSYVLATAQPTTHTLSTHFNVAGSPLQAYRALTTEWQLIEWLDAADAVFDAHAGGPWRVTYAGGRLEEGLVIGAWPRDSLRYTVIAADTHDVTFRFDAHGFGTRMHLQDVVRAGAGGDSMDSRTALADWWEPRLDRLAAFLNSAPGCYVARPATVEAVPGVIVLPDRFGLNSTVRALCDSLAQSGYVAIAADLLRGEVTSDVSQAEEFVTFTADSLAVAAALRAYLFLLDQPDVEPRRIGVWGIGYGARIALATLAVRPKLKAGACWYPTTWPDAPVLRRIACPIQALFGERDISQPGPAATAFSQALAQAGIRVDIALLNAAPSFADPGYGAEYDARTAREALQRTIVYLDTRLRY